MGFLRWKNQQPESEPQVGPSDWPKWLEDPAPKEWPPAEVAANRLRITYVGHATTLVQVAGFHLMTDPVWSKSVGPFFWLGSSRRRAPGVPIEKLPRIDAVVISHNHYDHLDLPTLQRLPGKPALFAGLGNAAFLRQNDLDTGRDVDWWEEISQFAQPHGIRLIATPAQHWSFRSLGNSFATLWASYVIVTPLGKVYFAGDTGMGPHFALIRARLGAMDYCLLPIGPAYPRSMMKLNHISPEEAVEAHVILGCKTSIPIHFDTFKHGEDRFGKAVNDVLAELKRRGMPPDSFQVLKPGEFAEF